MSLFDLEIRKYNFKESFSDNLKENYFAQNLWPIVYIIESELKNGKKIGYVGETTDIKSRINSHQKNDLKKDLDFLNLITCDKFNKSATLDIESNLIKYISGEENFKLLNGNLGLSNHNYYQKNEIYSEIFKLIWDKLRSKGVVNKSIEEIENSDIFKYSPYKSLNKDQLNGLLIILDQIANGNTNTIIVEGGAGTGKSVLSIFLFKLLNSNLDDFKFKELEDVEEKAINLAKKIKTKFPSLKMGLVIPMSSFRETLKKTFTNVKGLNKNMVIGPSEILKCDYDLILVDESHRLRRRINLTNYDSFDKTSKALGFNPETSNELDWILKKSKKTILFYDESQSIKPTDIESEKFKKLINENNFLKLKSQFRVRAGNDYVKFIDSLLKNNLDFNFTKFNHSNYKLLLFDNLNEMIEKIKDHNKINGLSRVVAGFSWKWISKNDKNLKDIKIGDCELSWNSVFVDWISSKNSINEIGCIHTVQGYDLNYCGIIFGNEISYNPISNSIFIKPENYHDKKGKNTIKNAEELKNYIINIYKTMMLRGINGTYLYVCDQNLKKYFETYINKYQSIINIPKIVFITYNLKPYIDSVPFYDLKVSAGKFSDLQNINDLKWIKISDKIKISKDLFVCQVIGESMNKVIPNGSFCIFKKDNGGSRNGRIVLVESLNLKNSEFGSCFTIKEYQSTKYIDENGWSHQKIILKPRSNDHSFRNIELKNEETETFKVIGIFEKIIDEETIEIYQQNF